MNVRDALVQRINQRIIRAREVFDRFDNDTAEATMVGPRWNVRDLAGHLLHWAQEGAAQIPRAAAGAEPPAYDLASINDGVYRKYRRMSYVMLLSQLRRAEEALVRAVSAVAPSLLLDDTPARRAVDAFGMEHYDHHWPGLRDAAERR